VLPGAGFQVGAAVLQVNLRDLQIHFGVLHSLIFSGQQALRGSPVVRSQTLAFAGMGVETVKRVAQAAINQPIAF